MPSEVRPRRRGPHVFDPLDALAEVLGEPARDMRSPANADFLCPHANLKCVKFNRTLGEPVPVCSVFKKGRLGSIPQDGPPVCICPVRFYEADIVGDVIRECWVGKKPEAPRVAHEVTMGKFGKVDMVIADVQENPRRVGAFLPVELQAVDITGSYRPIYEAHTLGTQLEKPSTYNFNWANVRKRFLSQLIGKGYYCHHWETRIVAVVQEELFAQFNSHAKISETKLEDSNIIFLLYQFSKGSGGRWSLGLRRVVPTTHNQVMQSILYERPPSRTKFEKKILERL